jgi:hypothetical protein
LLSDYSSPGVNFSASGIVNRHQLEAFILDQRGRIAHAVARRRWDQAELVRLATSLLTVASSLRSSRLVGDDATRPVGIG